MLTANNTLIKNLKTGACAFALVSMLIAPLPSLAANENASAAKADTKVQQNAQDQTTEKRKQIASEAVKESEIIQQIKERTGAGLKSQVWERFGSKCFHCGMM